MHVLTDRLWDAYKKLKIEQGKLDAIQIVQEETKALRSRGERPTWDLWEGVIEQIRKEICVSAALAARDALNRLRQQHPNAPTL